MGQQVLRLPEVRRRTGLSRSTIYSFVSAGDFPKQIHLGPRLVGWLESEVDGWIASKMECSVLKGAKKNAKRSRRRA